jgi:CIC family chloride channel protein
MNKIYRTILRILALLNVRSVGRYMVLGIFVGVVAGVGALAFFAACQWCQHYLLDYLAGFRPGEPYGEPVLFSPTDTPLRRWMLLLVPALGGLLAGWLVYTFAPEAEGHGTDAAIDAFHHKQGRIRKRVPIIKAVASALTIGSGGSGGREGPIAQIGAGFGSFLADKLGLPGRDRRVLLAAGVGAGIGSIFRAPLAGALFAAEILYNEPEFETEVIIPATVTTIVAYSVFGMVAGFNPLFRESNFVFSHPFELGPYTVLALVLALGSIIYVRCFYGTKHAFDRLKIPKHVKPMIGGFLTGCVGFFLPQSLAVGYGVLQHVLDGGFTIPLLLAIAFGKIITTSLTIGSGGSAGVFGPSMVIGGALGGVVGKLFHQWMPTIVTQPGSFVIVGMAGFFAGASNAPISTIIMVSEMTGNYKLLMPAMWVCALAFIIAKRWSIYEAQVPTRADSPAHYGDFARDVLEDIYVRDVFHPDGKHLTVNEHMTLREFIPIMTETDQQVFPVINSRGELTGLLSINDVRDVLVERELDNLLILKEVADEEMPVVTPNDDLASALSRFTENEVDAVPVVDATDKRHLLGMLHRNDVTRSYYEKLQAMKHVSQG